MWFEFSSFPPSDNRLPPNKCNQHYQHMEDTIINWSELPLEVFAHIVETCSVTNVVRLTSVCKIWRDNLLNESIWKEIYERNFMVIKGEPTTLKTFRARAIKSEIITTNMRRNRYVTRWKNTLSEDITQTVSVTKDKLLITYANKTSKSTSPSLFDLNTLKASKIEAKCKNMATTKDYYIYFVSTHPAVSNLSTGQKIDFQHRSRIMQLMQSILLPIDNRKLLNVTLNTDLEENSFITWSNTLQKLFWIDPVSNTYKAVPLLDKINEVRIDGQFISYSVQEKPVTHVYNWKTEEYIYSLEHERNIYSWMIYREHMFVSDSDGWHIMTMNGDIIKQCRVNFEDNSPSTNLNYHNGIVVLQSERCHLFYNGCTTELLCELTLEAPFLAPKMIGRGEGKFLIWSKHSMFLLDFESTT